MSFLLPKNKTWGVANWVSHGFFADAEPFLDQVPSLADDISFCIKSQTDTVDLREASVIAIQELKTLVDKVISSNREKAGRDFHQPEMFPIYMNRLEELKLVVDSLLDGVEPK
jgi:hypothetical protein